MRFAYLECFSGISGDMFLGALVDAGVSPALLETAVSALNLGARLVVMKVIRSGIAATKVDVWGGDEREGPAEDSRTAASPPHAHEPVHDHALSHEHHHS